MIKALLITVLFIPMSLFIGEETTVCNCPSFDDISLKDKTTNEFYNASIIFIGEVTKVEDLDKTPIGKLKPFDVPIKYTFKVSEMIKGGDARVIEIYSAQSSVHCGYTFEVGTKYLVHSKKSITFQKYTPDTWSNTTSECIGNTLRRHTEKNRLDLLRKLAKS